MSKIIQSSKPNHKRAFTLIEVVSTLTMGSLLALLAVSVLHQVFNLRRGVQEGLELSSRLDQVFVQFRRDAWLADRVEVESPRQILFHRGKTTVTYKITDDSLQRTEGDLNAEIETLSGGSSANKLRTTVPISQWPASPQTRRIRFAQNGDVVSLTVFIDGPESQQWETKDTPKTANEFASRLERRVTCKIGKWSTTANAGEQDEA